MTEHVRALAEKVRLHLAGRGEPVTAAGVERALAADGIVRGVDGMRELGLRVRAELLGTGPLQDLLDDPDVTDVLVNGADGVWTDGTAGLRRTDLHLGASEEIRTLAVRLASVGGRRLDDASPTVDARLPDGTRLHAVLPPLAPGGPLISLRTQPSAAFTFETLCDHGLVDAAGRRFLWTIVAERRSFLVSGATGSGKTTLLAALLALVPPSERIVVLEEVEELRVEHPHAVGLTARRANAEGTGSVTLTDLVREALRMRPDRIVMGECRGAEMADLLAALNTGHEGGCGTIHANACRDVPARLEALGALAGLGREAVAAQAASAIDVLVHVRRRGGHRFVEEIARLIRDDTGRLVTETVVSWDGHGHPDPASRGAAP